MASNITAMAKTYYDCLPVPEEIELMIMWWKYRMEQTDIRYRKLHKSHMADVNRLYQVVRDVVHHNYSYGFVWSHPAEAYGFVSPSRFIASPGEFSCKNTISDIQTDSFAEKYMGTDVYENYVPKTVALSLEDDIDIDVTQIKEIGGVTMAYYENINYGKYVIIDRDGYHKNFNTYDEAYKHLAVEARKEFE
jgi:hypothetical protein